MAPLEEDRAHPRWAVVVAGIACAVTALLYLGLKQFSYRYVPGDENIYYYMAKVMAQGEAWPYRDFFFAHPPVQLLVAASAFKLCGASFVVARSLPILSGLACGLAVFVIGYRRFGPLEAAISQAAFLLAYGTLRNSSHFTGANLGLALLLWGFYCLLRRRDLLGGVLLALSAQTVVYAVPGVVMVLAWRCLEEPKRAGRAVGAMVGLYLLISLGCLILGGGGYTEAVFKYHLMKKPVDQAKAPIFSRVFRLHDFYLTWAPVVAAAALAWWRRELPKSAPGQRPGSAAGPDRTPLGQRPQAHSKRRQKAAGLPPAAGGRPSARWSSFLASRQGLVVGLILYTVGYMVFLLRLREWFDFYFLALFPALALLAGYVVGEIAVGVGGMFRKAAPFLALRSLVLCVLIGLGYATVKYSQRQQYPGARGKTYAWFDAPGGELLNSFFRRAFWHAERDIDRDYLGPTYYLWHEMRHLEEVRGAVDYIRRHSAPEDRLFGESGLAPLVAFLSDRDLAGFVADTNTKRFTSGQTTIETLLAKIALPELRYVIASKGRGGFQYVNAYLADWLENNFREVYRFRSQMRPGVTWFVLERRRPVGAGSAPPAAPQALGALPSYLVQSRQWGGAKVVLSP